ncbi:MAG TPA: DJ-1/PfpI family protein, partial [Acidobacteriaceae bacterium]|nr:DJ-1/PfpI family protein [Acidobacteriaceae bacterium]
MRTIVITGPPPVQILDVTGPLEVFASAPDYQVVLGSADGGSLLHTSRGFALTGARPLREIPGSIDTLLVAGGPGAESGAYDLDYLAWIGEAAARSRRVASICTGAFLLAAAG